MRQKCYRFCAMLLMPFMMVINCPMTGLAADAADVPEMNIKITHDPVKEATAGQRIPLEAKVVDEAGVEIVRAYFKAVEAAEFNFVVLTSSENDTYRGTLPAPANGVGAIDYLILVKNANNQVVKTQTYRITVADSDNAAAAVAKNDQITVYTELQEAPTEITGFSDNIAVDIVESGAKLGVVVGLYSTATAGGSTSGAVAGGTVAASTGGISTTAIVIGSVVAAAAVGAVAVASSSSDDHNDQAQALTPQTILGSWNVSENGRTGVVVFYDNGRWRAKPNNGNLRGNLGSWNLSGAHLTMSGDYGGGWSGTVSGNSRKFTVTGSTTAYFSR